jgi:alpha-L-fucosidase
MKRKHRMRMSAAAALFLWACCAAVSQPLTPVGPLPSDAQLAWQEMEFNVFIHFGPNTFTDREWGEGTENEDVFDPEHLDCEQWARIARTAGAKGMIITAKHHDGFCLWPSATSEHTVAKSRWRGGKGDVLKELAEACEIFDLKFGVYVSPWDRNHPAYGTPGYNDVFVRAITEIFANYGPLFELWWDGANGEGPDGKRQRYDFRRYENVVRDISPGTLMFSDIGPDLRWVGNEDGIAGETNWNLLDTAGFGRGADGPPAGVLNAGNENGALWIPAECDVSIRPGWFYHEAEDGRVRSPRELMGLYLASVGRGSTLLLNVPPGPDGLISPADSAALVGFAGLRAAFFSKNLAAEAPVFSDDTRDGFYVTALTDDNPTNFWAAAEGVDSPSVVVSLGPERRFNTVVLREYLALGQRVRGFLVEVNQSGAWTPVASGTTIGHKRILQFPPVMASRVRLTITASKAAPAISELSVYSAEEYPVK